MLSDFIPLLPWLSWAAILGLFVYISYLHGRLEAQSNMIRVMINSIKRLEGEIYK